MLIMLKILSFLGGVFISQTYIEKHWVTGPVFGAVVLFWHWCATKRFSAGRYASFLAASTLIYALVVKLMDLKTPDTGVMHYIIPGVLAGTVLLLLAHKIFLGLGTNRIFLGIPIIYIAAYAAGTFFENINPPLLHTFLSAVGFWQAAYLIITFGWRKNEA